MGQPDGVGPHLPDESHIGIMVFAGNRVANAFPVLVTAHAAQRITPPVEKKTFPGIHMKVPHTKPSTDLIYLFAIYVKCRDSGVQIRTLHSVPKLYIGHI